MRITNTMNGQKEELSHDKRDASEFRMFVCGPTVQDNVHVGHAKTYITFDVLARWLLKSGCKVYFLMNITDVDDKIFDRAKKDGVPYMQIADKFYREFLEDLESVNIVTVSKFARVSNYIEKSIELVSELISLDKAYFLNGSVYFDTSKADHYGKLSGQSEFDLRMKVIDAAPGKRNSVDFLLWRNFEEGREGVWQSKLGPGRPGWHIEDSGIAFEEFRGPYDLHGGATELIFPHHESELAQDEAISGHVPFVSVWMHTGLLLKDKEKMSKSLGNVVTIRDALRTHSPDALRIYFLRHHYRDSFEYSAKEIETECAQILSQIRAAARAAPKLHRSTTPARNLSPQISRLDMEFRSALDNDLDTPNAIKILLQLSNEIIQKKDDALFCEEAALIFWDIVETLGLTPSQSEE